MRTIARAVVNHPWLVVLAWAAGITAVTLWGPAFDAAPHSSLGLPPSSETARAAALQTHFGNTSGASATVVSQEPGGAAALHAWLAKAPDVEHAGPPLLSQDKQAVLIPLTFTHGGATLDSALGPMEDHLAGAGAAITGDAVASHDFNVAAIGNSGSTGSSGSPLRVITLLAVVAVLALVYRAPLAVVTPLLGVGASFLVSPHLVGGIGVWLGLPVSDLTLLFMFSVTLGAGTNYGLFLISNYREQLAAGLAQRQALESALVRAGEAIAFSAATVVAATGLMALASFDLFRTLGPPVAIAVATTLLAGLTLVPALVAIFGRAFFWPRRAPKGSLADHGAWRRAGDLVVRRPAWLAGACALLLIPPRSWRLRPRFRSIWCAAFLPPARPPRPLACSIATSRLWPTA
jgi:putative drug exporter of the RND superfamily